MNDNTRPLVVGGPFIDHLETAAYGWLGLFGDDPRDVELFGNVAKEVLRRMMGEHEVEVLS